MDGPEKTIGHFFYIKSSFVHHFKSIREFKLELQSGNAQLGSKLMIFCPVWPWNLMDDLEKIGHLFYTTSSFVHHFKSIGEVNLELESGNAQFGSKLEIFCRVWPWNWWITLDNNTAPLLYYIKLCVSFVLNIFYSSQLGYSYNNYHRPLSWGVSTVHTHRLQWYSPLRAK